MFVALTFFVTSSSSLTLNFKFSSSLTSSIISFLGIILYNDIFLYFTTIFINCCLDPVIMCKWEAARCSVFLVFLKDFGVKQICISDLDLPFIVGSHLTCVNFSFLLQNERAITYFTELEELTEIMNVKMPTMYI